ncbi:MAG TPA: DNA mismatch repair protein MutS [Gemmatimonadaceae bacterium]|nr:DNA mismatch repair protein MutS [Gemmatimonadaceae bacterium]
MSATPLMQQYREIKSRHQDAILFFRMGEFYEMFYDDAETASRTLGLTLTSRNNGGAADVPLAGVPVKAAGDYVRRLVQHGFRVAICEQVEDPKVAKGVVRREVIETVTPGAAISDDLLDGSRNNYVCAISRSPVTTSRPSDPDTMATIGIAAADISTGELRLAVVTSAELEPILARLAPREILLARALAPGRPDIRFTNSLVTEREAWEFDGALARDDLQKQFGVLSLDGLGIGAEDALAVGAAGALLRYLKELQPAGVSLAHPIVERAEGVLPLDEMTRRNLELVESLRREAHGDRETAGTLIDVLDRTMTPMGARRLRQWILAPLASRRAIDARLDGVEEFARAPLARESLRMTLTGVRDIERLATKAALGRSTPRELGWLGGAISRLPAVRATLREVVGGDSRSVTNGGSNGNAHVGASLLIELLEAWDDCGDLVADIQRTLVEDAPMGVGEEPTIATGVDAELDELRGLRDGGRDAIARIQAEERQRTGIQSLKVGFNKVFGYYIEVTKSNLPLVPSDYQRRQTITTGERFVTQALKTYEEKVLTASERIEQREREIFDALRARVGSAVARLQRTARALATIDALAALAEVAAREAYVRPRITDDFALRIRAGRHPVVERMMPRDKFVPNDVHLSDDARVVILTGPNMAGKSTILRQVGLIALMAHIGSFVPADEAEIGVLDRLFTRVGASDNLARGQSTFMVEMAETSAILHTATSRSLVLLDEIGRGTSTYDGVSIAWAVTEHLHDTTRCKTIFATHYHELTQLADELPALRNYNVAVREVGDRILFVHRLEPGGADRSYGIEVGRLAGLPAPLLERARHLLRLLESEQLVKPKAQTDATGQLGLFAAAPHPVVERLADVDVNALTPIQALALLDELSRQAKTF